MICKVFIKFNACSDFETLHKHEFVSIKLHPDEVFVLDSDLMKVSSVFETLFQNCAFPALKYLDISGELYHGYHYNDWNRFAIFVEVLMSFISLMSGEFKLKL